MPDLAFTRHNFSVRNLRMVSPFKPGGKENQAPERSDPAPGRRSAILGVEHNSTSKGQPANRASKGTNTRSCRVHVLRHRQSHSHFTPPGYTHDIPGSVSASASDGVLFPENTSDSDYMEPAGNASVFDENSAVESVGRKRQRAVEENTDDTSDEPKMLNIKRRRLKRCRTTNMLEENNSSDKSLATSGSPKPELNGSTKTVERKKLKPRRKTQPKLKNVTAIKDDRLFVCPLGETHRFTFQNQSCSHSSPVVLNQGTVSASTDTTGSLSTAPDYEFDTSCVALKAFGMSFFRPLGMIFCQIHKVCVPLSSLKSHITTAISRRHTGILAGPSGKNLIDPFLSHVASAFHLPLDQEFSSQGLEAKQLSKPIPYMEEPRIYLQCPSCKLWLCQSGKGGWKSPAVRQHLTQSKSNTQCARLLLIPETKRPPLKECYGQRPCGTRGVGNQATIPFVEIIGWSPETAAVPGDSHVNLHSTHPPSFEMDLSQPYVKACKWNTNFPASLAEVLHELCLLPNSSFFTGEEADDNNDAENVVEAETLERGLYEVQIFLQRYLENANTFVISCEVGFRSALTHGTNSEFRDLSDGSYHYYHYPLLHSIAFLLRLKFRHDRGHCLPEDIKVPFTQSLQRTRNELYKFLMSAPLEKEIDLTMLGTLVHRILVSMLTAQCRVIDCIGHIFDITVPMALYNGDGIYRSASCATRYCAQMQYCLRSVVVHVIRLGGPCEPFTLFEIPATGILPTEDSTVEHGEESLDLEELEAVDDVYPFRHSGKFKGPSVKEPLYFIDDDDDTSGSGSCSNENKSVKDIGRDKLLVLLDEYGKWIECWSQSKHRTATAFSKIKCLWAIIFPYQSQVSSSTRIEWTDRGHSLSYYDHGCRQPFFFRLSTYLTMVQELVNEAQNLYVSFLPRGYESPTVDISALRDNGSLGQSLFEQEPNRAIFTPHARSFYNAVVSDSTRSREEFHSQEQKLLQALLAAISTTMGVPPRAFQLAGMLYKANEENCYKRNLYIKKGIVVLGWPRSKSFKSAYQVSLWALPVDVGKILLDYLGIIRPASIRLLQKDNMDIHNDLHTHIFSFIKCRKSKHQSWPPTHVNAILKAATGSRISLELSAARLRQLLTAIYRKFFPEFIQLTPFRSLINYGFGHGNCMTPDNSFHHFFGSQVNLSDGSVSEYIASSQVWQGVLRMLPDRCGIFASIGGPRDAQVRDANQALALDQARWLICHSAVGLDAVYLKEKALALLADQSLISLPSEPPEGQEELVGKFNDILIKVAAVVIYGFSLPSPEDAAPINGFEPEVIAQAGILIVQALQDCAGYPTPYAITKQDILLQFESVAHTRPVVWRRLGVEILQHKFLKMRGNIHKSRFLLATT